MKCTARLCSLVALLAATVVACGDDTDTEPSPTIDNASLELPRAVDQDPADGTFELDLTAAPADITYGDGPSTPAWAYNGSVPGPLIEVAQGDHLRVHFRNDLPDETTIHWHGVRLPAAMDGSVFVQSPVQPGASFEYEFDLKDSGLFWFHPHVVSDLQVQRGLYGTILVRGENEPEFDRELVVVLDDIRLLADGSIDEYPDDDGITNGREGNTLLFNGQVSPTLRAQPGETLRLRLVNTANGRFFNLKIAGHQLRVAGTDGGLIPIPYDVDSLPIAPGERYDVFVSLSGDVGDELAITTEPYDRGHGTDDNPSMPLATLSLEGSKVTGKPLPEDGPAAELFAEGGESFAVVLGEAFIGGEQKFTINGAVSPDVPDVMVPNGETRIIELQNDTEQEHPFHLHGFFFQTIARDGVPVPESERFNKDTIISPMMSTLTLAARFDEPGMWMYHCHILEHAERGMMGMVHVE